MSQRALNDRHWWQQQLKRTSDVWSTQYKILPNRHQQNPRLLNDQSKIWSSTRVASHFVRQSSITTVPSTSMQWLPSMRIIYLERSQTHPSNRFRLPHNINMNHLQSGELILIVQRANDDSGYDEHKLPISMPFRQCLQWNPCHHHKKHGTGMMVWNIYASSPN